MKLSELKSIIRECIEELNEGPAREYRRSHGIQYKHVARDPLKAREDNAKRNVDGWKGLGILKKKPLKDMIKRDKNSKTNKVYHDFKTSNVVHRKRASGGSAEDARKRQWNIDHLQDVGSYKVTKRGKLPKDIK